MISPDQLNHRICDCVEYTGTEVPPTTPIPEASIIDSWTCVSWHSYYIEGNGVTFNCQDYKFGEGENGLCVVLGEDIPMTENSNYYCKGSSDFTNYTCTTASLKDAIHCEGTECNDLIRILCNGTDTCDKFTLPLPDGVAPKWCVL